MTEMSERAAKAIHVLRSSTREMQAIAAIKAMREPTDSMLAAGGCVLLDACSSEKGFLHPWKPFDVAQTAKRTFEAMIDEALKP